jgi:hypothetical protein
MRPETRDDATAKPPPVVRADKFSPIRTRSFSAAIARAPVAKVFKSAGFLKKF